MSKENGGPAFPVSSADPCKGHQDGRNTWQFPGMTLRDSFAASALSGLMAHEGGVDPTTSKGDRDYKDATARVAYEIADAMLAERSK